MTIGSGLGAQLGHKHETTFGVTATPDHFNEFDSETLKHQPTYVQGKGLRAGNDLLRSARNVLGKKTASGTVTMDLPTRTFGTWLQHMLGSTPTPAQIATSGAYDAYFTPADLTGKGLTVQVGRPQTDGTVKAYTYRGCKVTGWEVSVQAGDIAKVAIDLDALDEDDTTALAVASYATGSSMFTGMQVSAIKVGGTAATASGKTTITGGVALTSLIRSLSVKGANNLATDRFGLQTTKAEQIANDFRAFTVALTADFDKKTELYDLFKAGTISPLQITFVGDPIGDGTQRATIDIIAPAVRWDGSTPNVSGPDIVQLPMTGQLLWDEVNPSVQIHTVSTDATL